MYEYEADVANFAKYFDIYNLMRISKGATVDQLKKWLISEGMPETSARRHIKEFTEDYEGWLYDYDEESEEYSVSKSGMAYFIRKLSELNIPAPFEPPVRTLRATIPVPQSQ